MNQLGSFTLCFWLFNFWKLNIMLTYSEKTERKNFLTISYRELALLNIPCFNPRIFSSYLKLKWLDKCMQTGNDLIIFNYLSLLTSETELFKGHFILQGKPLTWKMHSFSCVSISWWSTNLMKINRS